VDAIVTAMASDLDADTRLVFDGPDVVAAGVVPTPAAGANRMELLGGVHPQWRGRGIGRQLLAWQLHRATQIHRASTGPAPWFVEVSANAADLGTLRLFGRSGLTPARYDSEMLAPTGGRPTGVLPGGLRCTPYTESMESELYAAHVDAFSDHKGFEPPEKEAWLAATVRPAAFLPDLSLVALDGERIVTYTFVYADPKPDRVYLGCGGTRRDWRRRGVARALLAEVLATIGAAGVPHISLHTDSDNPFGVIDLCERAGFRSQARFVAYRMPL
jgi:ribosomal protein S18 acetylase RimI-like enzyme